jgi:hypothetical protein
MQRVSSHISNGLALNTWFNLLVNVWLSHFDLKMKKT